MYRILVLCSGYQSYIPYTSLREFVLTTVILPPGVGNLGSALLSWMRFRFKVVDPLDLLDPLQNSRRPILKHPSDSFGTFGRNMGFHFEPNP